MCFHLLPKMFSSPRPPPASTPVVFPSLIHPFDHLKHQSITTRRCGLRLLLSVTRCLPSSKSSSLLSCCPFAKLWKKWVGYTWRTVCVIQQMGRHTGYRFPICSSLKGRTPSHSLRQCCHLLQRCQREMCMFINEIKRFTHYMWRYRLMSYRYVTTLAGLHWFCLSNWGIGGEVASIGLPLSTSPPILISPSEAEPLQCIRSESGLKI